jgi:hypothetical protein
MAKQEWIENFNQGESVLIMRLVLLQHRLIEISEKNNALPQLETVKHLVASEFKEFNEIDAYANLPTRMEARCFAIADIIYNRLVHRSPEDYTFDEDFTDGIVDYSVHPESDENDNDEF